MDFSDLPLDKMPVSIAAALFIVKTIWSMISQDRKQLRSALERNTRAIERLTLKIEGVEAKIEDLPRLQADVEDLNERLKLFSPKPIRAQ